MPSANQETRQMPMQTLDAVFLSRTANTESRTIDVQWYSGATVERYDYRSGKGYFLRFEMTEQACDLSRLNKGANLLNSHFQWDLNSILGVVEKAWLQDGKGMATVRFSTRPDVEPFWQDVKNGVIRNISMGASASEYAIDKNGPGGAELWTATKWQPMEISLVSVPADADASTRLSANQPLYPCLLQRLQQASQQEDKPMPEQNLTQNNPEANPAPAASAQQSLAAHPSLEVAIAAERERTAQILKSARALNLDQKLADEMIKTGLSLEAAKLRMFDLAAEAGEASQIRLHAAAENQPNAAVDPSLPVEQRCKAEWDSKPELRAEFGGDFPSYLAYQKAEEAGWINKKAA